MASSHKLNITLPEELVEAVKAKVAAGEYASESEVVRDGLNALLARDRALETWLHDEVAPAFDAIKADPLRALSSDDVRAGLAAKHAAARKNE